MQVHDLDCLPTFNIKLQLVECNAFIRIRGVGEGSEREGRTKNVITI